ncbi:hypothetical protein KJ925_05110 [Patescibacteria group bacterium]|nr:hypothetical protein [Patescibacteria group bacterium]
MMFIDTREKRSRIPVLLEKMNIPITYTDLEVGDYIIGDICVERKEINDYIGSLSSGHLEEQLYNMSVNFNLSYILIEGIISEALMYRKMKRAPLISSLVGCSLKRASDGKQGRINTVNLENAYDTALFLKFLHNRCVSKDEIRLPRIKKVPHSNTYRLLYITSSIPGIGHKKAELFLSRFKTIKGFTNATVEELMGVDGIGKKLAQKIFDILNKEFEGGEEECSQKNIDQKV